jgi:hypothetical protein
MKRYYVLQVMLVMASAMFAGCEKDPDGGNTRPEDRFKELTEMGVYDESMTGIYLYDENAAQYAVSAKYNTTRIQNDDKSKFVRIVMDGAPKAEADVAVSITCHGFSGGTTAAESLKAIKMDGGKIWLMDEESKICYIMPWTIDN